MNKRKNVINIPELPLRTHQLSENELASIFGGKCKKLDHECKKNKDCCSSSCRGMGYVDFAYINVCDLGI
jgi:hypothetical protein